VVTWAVFREMILIVRIYILRYVIIKFWLLDNMGYLYHHPRHHIAFMGLFTFIYDIPLCYDKIIYKIYVSQNTTILRH
jgi:hypothetical protein